MVFDEIVDISTLDLDYYYYYYYYYYYIYLLSNIQCTYIIRVQWTNCDERYTVDAQIMVNSNLDRHDSITLEEEQRCRPTFYMKLLTSETVTPPPPENVITI